MHLAYAPEIAQVMLRRQQAEAIIAARKKIVHGAVSMVEMALHELSAKQVVNLDDERKAAMVSNLMTVLCAESDVQPVINTGTLYNVNGGDRGDDSASCVCTCARRRANRGVGDVGRAARPRGDAFRAAAASPTAS